MKIIAGPAQAGVETLVAKPGAAARRRRKRCCCCARTTAPRHCPKRADPQGGVSTSRRAAPPGEGRRGCCTDAGEDDVASTSTWSLTGDLVSSHIVLLTTSSTCCGDSATAMSPAPGFFDVLAVRRQGRRRGDGGRVRPSRLSRDLSPWLSLAMPAFEDALALGSRRDRKRRQPLRWTLRLWSRHAGALVARSGSVDGRESAPWKR